MFELLNVKWGDPTFGTPSGQITWSSELNGDLPIADGFDLDDIEASLRSAFSAWEDVAAVDFQEVASGGEVTISNGPLDGPTVGLAGPFPVAPTQLFTMSSATVVISDTLDGGLEWSPFGAGGIDFFAVAAHEIGHVIGLEHPNDPTQIMNAVIQVDELGEGDIQGAQFLYGTDGDDVELDPGFPDNADEIGLGGSGDGGTIGDSDGGGGGAGGLILGLLALVGAFFTGGTSLAFAAAQIARATDDDDDGPRQQVARDPFEPPEEEPAELAALFNAGEDCGHLVHEGALYHGVTVPEMLPAIDFTTQPNPCGCVGLCEHILDEHEPTDSVVV